MPKLRIRKNNRWEEKKFDDDVFSIGREADNNLVIESFFISRKHCEIKQDEQGFFLEDLGSKVGVQVNNKPVKGKIRLKSGDLLTFADKFEAMFLDTKEQTVTTTLIAQDADENFTGAVLTGLDGPTNTQVFGLDKNITKIGRNPACDICIPTHTVSQAHAEITREKRNFIITDLGSVNGTFVNNQRVQRQQLETGDLVRFDWISFRFHTLEALRREGKSITGMPHHEGHATTAVEDPDRTRAVEMPISPAAPQEAETICDQLPPVPSPSMETEVQQSEEPKPAKGKNLGFFLALLFLVLLSLGSLVIAFFVMQWLF
jgi:pSer/pThr/pTyr-binding forkhead associated (FHA) protein